MNKETLIQRIKEKHEKNLSHFSVIDYINSQSVITINKYGTCVSTAQNLIKGKIPSITSSINKTEYFINQAKEIHGNKYDYSKSNWIKSSIKIIIICPIHGEFLQCPNNHLRKSGCPTCGNISTIEKIKLDNKSFIEKVKLKHNNFYTYENTKYISCYKNVLINCPIHGEFEIPAYLHLYGQGCKKCGFDRISKARKEGLNGWEYTIWEKKGKLSKYFDSFKCYIIECYDENEKFYKIGKTYTSIKHRFRNKNLLPYKYKIIKVFEGSSKEISEIETILKNKNKKHSYLPFKNFGGKYECFSNIDI